MGRLQISDATRQVIDRDNDFYDAGVNARDVIPSRSVNLADRFSGKGEGFSANHTRQLDSSRQMPMEDIDRETGEFSENHRQQDQQRQQQSREQGSDRQQGNASGRSNEGGGYSGPRIEAATFTAYSNALMRFSSVESLTKGHDQFWAGGGRAAPGDGTADHALAPTIFASHLKRAKGEATPDDTKASIEKLIAGLTKL